MHARLQARNNPLQNHSNTALQWRNDVKRKPPAPKLGHIERPPTSWVQIERMALVAMNSLIRDNPTAARILVSLAAKADRQGAVVASQSTLARIAGVHRTTLWRGLKALEQGSWVQLIRLGNATAVVLNSRVAWADSRDKIGQAMFTATVIGSADEQDRQSLRDSRPLRRVPTLIPPEIAVLVGRDGSDQPELPGIE